MTIAASSTVPSVPRSAYFHIPFCQRRCGYCHFALESGRDYLMEPFLKALEMELAPLGGPHRLDTLYWGGGTPTALPRALIERLKRLVEKHFELSPSAEFTCEANPNDVDERRIQQLVDLGVSRISLGAQSFHLEKLQQLERKHTPRQIRCAFDAARLFGLDVAIDLMFAAPRETLAQWQNELLQVIQFRPDHVSTYQLTIEKGTTFWSRHRRGDLALPDDEATLEMYLMAIAQLTQAGWEHYEVSSFAQPGCRSRHNQVYWSGEPYWAFGPGAASFVDGIRRVNHASVTTYIRRLLRGESPVAQSESLDAAAQTIDRLVFGLRRLEGVDVPQLEASSGFRLEQLVGPTIDQLIDRAWLVWNGSQLKLTRQGLLFCDDVCAAFIGASMVESSCGSSSSDGDGGSSSAMIAGRMWSNRA